MSSGTGRPGSTQIARLVKSDVGLRVAAIDLGGWDLHTHIGTVDEGEIGYAAEDRR